MRPQSILQIASILCLVAGIVDCRAVEGETRRPKRKFTIEELLTTKFPRGISGDLDIDICKAGGFLGDIALPNIKYETEWRQQKLNKSYLEALEKYRDEVLKEGLQVEEEGLTEILQFKNEHVANNEARHEDEEAVVSQGKSEPIMVDRNQYSMNGEPEDAYSFNARNDETRPEIRDEGIEFRYEFTTLEPVKRRHSGRRQFRRDPSKDSGKGFAGPIEQRSSSSSSTEKTKYIETLNEEDSTSRPETSTHDRSKRRHRRHHRRR